MIDRTSKLPTKRQCAILELPRSTTYYKPSELSEADHALMRRIDELHLAYPFAGSRMLTGMLKQAGHEVGHRHVRTVMRKMGIEATSRCVVAFSIWSWSGGCYPGGSPTR